VPNLAHHAIIVLVFASFAPSASERAAAADSSPGFLEPPAYFGPAVDERAPTNRAITMVPSLVRTAGGRLWVTWYAGPTPDEDANNYTVLATSGDDGATWEEVLVIDPDGPGPVRAFDPNIWISPDGKLRLFWAQTVGHNGSVSGTWEMVATDPESGSTRWSAPRRLTDGIMMGKPVALSTGEWVLPISTWSGTDHSAKMVVSSDKGANWELRGAAHVPADVRSYDEQMFIERKDGTLWMLVRTKYGIGESISTDRGVTWPEVTPSSIPHPSARFFITRLQSGNLLLVKHGLMTEQTGRSHLMAFLSKDDGNTWEGGLLLDERQPISYPDGVQAADGTVYITYDYSRRGKRQILFATFREEDVLAGKPVTQAARLQQLVSQGSGGRPQQSPPSVGGRTDVGGAPMLRSPAGVLSGEGFAPAPLEPGVRLFADRHKPSHSAHEVPAALGGAQFLGLPIDGTKTLLVTRSGVVSFLTPQADRNRESQAQPLIDQGFRLAALPEFVLMTAASERQNLVSLYQKEVREGEVITIGKWAVPVLWP
jgi:predicted neuraminidase